MKAQNPIFIQFFILLLLTCSTIVSAEPPEWAQSAKAIEVTGELEVLYIDDFENNRGKKHYIVHDKRQGKHFELEFEGEPPKGTTTGSFVRVRGKANDNQIYMEANATNSFETLAPAATAVVSGEQKTIVLVADFQDATVSCPIQDIKDIMFTDPDGRSVDALYQETSLGSVQFTGEVSEPLAIKSRITDNCSISAWADAVDAEATANGISLNNFTRKVYVLPSNNGCGYTGMASVGGSPSRAWIFRCDMPDVFAHELGHNLGMGHASSVVSEYGDFSDVMGYSNFGLRQINSPHQEQMGWRESQQIMELTDYTMLDIAPLELDALSAMYPQILKIRKPDTGEYYYLSYRQQSGFDSNLPSGFMDGISIHRFAGGSQKTYLIDALTDGESFVDENMGVTITQHSHSDSSVLAEVIFSNISCMRNPPEITLSPLSRTAQAGDSVNYSVSINNRDSANCPDSTWMIETLTPMNWTESMTNNQVTIAPGSSQTINWTVTSTNNSADDNYALSMDILNTDPTAYDNLVTANYTVALPDDIEEPAAPTALTASVERKKILINWQPSTDNTAVAGYNIYRNEIQIATTASTSYSDSNLTSGEMYTYYTVAFDAANNHSYPSNSSSVTYSKAESSNKGIGKGGKKR